VPRLEATGVLQARVPRIELGAGETLCRAKTAVQPILGTEIFGQLGSGDRTLLDESVGALLAMPEIAIPNW